MHHKLEIDAECTDCKATGVFVGMAERDGSAVVCSTCKGTGKHHRVIEYDDFEGRKIRSGVKHVVQVNPGICIGQSENDKYRYSDFGGIPYHAFLEGKAFPPKSEMRGFTCPAWWYQSADYKRKPGWDECLSVGSFSSCKNFGTKSKCWERFDKEKI